MLMVRNGASDVMLVLAGWRTETVVGWRRALSRYSVVKTAGWASFPSLPSSDRTLTGRLSRSWSNQGLGGGHHTMNIKRERPIINCGDV